MLQDSLEQSNRHLTADKEDLSYTVDKKTKENDSLTGMKEILIQGERYW